MQCKDIPDAPILAHLAVHGGIGCTVWDMHGVMDEQGGFVPYDERSVLHAMPRTAPYKLRTSKMKMLMRRGLVEGCPCGCRGDWELTAKGCRRVTRAELEADSARRRGIVKPVT